MILYGTNQVCTKIHLGVFHTIVSYLNAIEKLMTGSGFEEVVIEAGICAHNSLDSVLKCMHYNRSMRVHSHVVKPYKDYLSHFLHKHKILENDNAAAIQSTNPSNKFMPH